MIRKIMNFIERKIFKLQYKLGLIKPLDEIIEYEEYEEFYPTEEDFIQEEEYRAYTLLGEEIYEKGSF